MDDTEDSVFTLVSSVFSGSILYVMINCILFVTTLFIVATVIWRQYYEHAADPDSKLPLPPGCMGFPLFGETFSFMYFDYDFNLSRDKKYGLINKTHLFGQPTIRISGAQNIRPILMGEHIIVDNNLPTSSKMLLGIGGVSTAPPELHALKKKLLLQALSPTVVSRCVPAIQDIVQKHLRDWSQQGELLGRDICKNLTLSIVADVLLGFDVDKQKMAEIKSEMITFLDNLFTIPWNIPGTGFYKAMRARGMITSAIKERMSIETNHWCVVDELKNISDSNEAFSQDGIVNAVLELWFAGNDTTASSSCLALMLIGRDDRVRDKIEEELKVNHLDDPNTELTYELIMKLTYLDHTLKEVLRLYPAAAGAFRKTRTVIEVGGYQVPKGWQILYGITDTHRASDLFSQKEDFLPERWTDMDEKTRDIQNKFDYVPFGAGARHCPGKHFAKTVLKIFIIELIRGYQWKLKNNFPKVLYFNMPHPTDGLPVTFKMKDDLRK